MAPGTRPEAVGPYGAVNYFRLSKIEEAYLRFTELDFQLSRRMVPMATSGTYAVEFLRRRPATFTVTFTINGGKIDV